MIKRFDFNSPINTGAVVLDIEKTDEKLPFFELSDNGDLGIKFTYKMSDNDIVYGLGEANRGINKRGYIYESFCSDEPFHTEDKHSLYGAHNFLLVDGNDLFGVFFDYPARIKFDIDYSRKNILEVSCEKGDISIYFIFGESPLEITREFRKLIGKSYIPPRWAFGYQQSRWSYFNKDDVLKVVKGYEDSGILLDAIYLDIDYMTEYMDFTVDEEKFPDFKNFVIELSKKGIRLVPIIDAGVKIKEGYDVYEEGVKNGYFCKTQDGENFKAAVWPGLTHFPDFLNSKAREWFGGKYKILTDMGIEGFWNDMNEPAIFYTERGMKKALDAFENTDKNNMDSKTFFGLKDSFLSVPNNGEDYKSFYHDMDGKTVCHNDVHNLYGFNMTKAAAQAFEKEFPNKRILLFSRASYIGMHRYGGIWMGDNFSWWSHILLNLKMLPSLSMCGFLYCGADIGGFNGNATRDLLLRWLSLAVFTPLMRNHSAFGTRQQEFYEFEDTDDFKVFIDFRHKLLPYLYSEFVKASLNDDLLFRPLAFDYPDDELAKTVEDQVLLGEGIMIAPVYTQNARGRYVYLPEDMTAVRVSKDEISEKIYQKGHHYIDIVLNELVFFIKKDHVVPVCRKALLAQDVTIDDMQVLGDGQSYTMYFDDGFSKDFDNKDNYVEIKKQK